ncbi:hypothetical protein SAMN04244548_02972 [Paracoccus pantotrophus]|nr:hypothetical protein SAMN04244548_02972 [Paracoccus pantotrophus]
MTIYLEVPVTGGTIGYKLADDPEEAAYALKEMARYAGEDFPGQLAEHTRWEAEECAGFLRKLADAIEAGAAE